MYPKKDENGEWILGYCLYDPISKEWFRQDKLFANIHSAKCAITTSCNDKTGRKFGLIVPVRYPSNPEEIGIPYGSKKFNQADTDNAIASYSLEKELLIEDS